MILDSQFIFVFILISIIFILGEFILKYTSLTPEFTRKLTHIFSGLVVFTTPAYLNLTQAVVLGVLASGFLILAEILKFLPSVTKVERKSYGSVLFPLGLVISGLLFWNTNIEAFKISVLILTISDSAAGLVGHRFGTRKFLSGTIEGSIIFFVSTVVIFISFGLILGSISQASLFFYVIFSLLLMLVEAKTTKGLDNLLLPPVSAFLASLLF